MHITQPARLPPESPAKRADWLTEGHDNEQHTVGKYAAGVGYQPPSGFSQIAKKTAARSATKFAIAVHPTI